MITKAATWKKEKLLGFLMILISMFLHGCAPTSMVVTPQMELPTDGTDLKITGKIVYDGNRDYLPRIIRDELGSDALLVLQYSYDVIHGRDKIHQAIPLFNPLTMLGFPIGENTLLVTGKLDILKRNEALRTYSASCYLEKSRSIFAEGETFSEIRKKGLFAVRDSIDAQLLRDREFLLKSKTAE